MLIQQTIEVPASRRITLDVPQDVPLGRTILTFTPALTKDQLPIGESSSASPSFTTLVELAKEAAAKTAQRAANPERFLERMDKCQEGGPLFDGIDGVKFQRSIRDEW
ncbi:hypothetical protein FACS1894200_07010 [Spirochaetia bacterium]|nr:hypothetical protein FACS1894200_07010 [Spirochaetia bacterium]